MGAVSFHSLSLQNQGQDTKKPAIAVGKSNELYFWWDNTSYEIDLIIHTLLKLILVYIDYRGGAKDKRLSVVEFGEFFLRN